MVHKLRARRIRLVFAFLTAIAFLLPATLVAVASGSVSFSRPVPDVFPNAPNRSCLYGIFAGPNNGPREHNWRILSRQTGTVHLLVETRDFNGHPGDSLTATIADDTGPHNFLAPYAGTANTEQTTVVELHVTANTPYDLAIAQTSGTEQHYKLGADERYVELGWGGPMHYNEGGRNVFAINADAGEHVELVVSADVVGAGVPFQATGIHWLVLPADLGAAAAQGSSPLSTSTPVTIAFDNNSGQGQTYVVQIEVGGDPFLSGHWQMVKTSGPDIGVYTLPCEQLAADGWLKSVGVVNPPQSTLVNQDTTITLSKVVTNNGPVSPAPFTLTTTASSPNGDCIFTQGVHTESLTLSMGQDTTVVEQFTVRCSQPSQHSFNFNGVLSPAGGLPDPNPGNNNGGAGTGFSVTALADLIAHRKDVSVGGVLVSYPGFFPDTDRDGLLDSQEALLRTNPQVADTDGDLFSDRIEFAYGTNPNDSNSMPPGSPPGVLPPPPQPDSDRDGLTDAQEALLRTNAQNADTDGDGVNDGEEFYRRGFDPTDPGSTPPPRPEVPIATSVLANVQEEISLGATTPAGFGPVLARVNETLFGPPDCTPSFHVTSAFTAKARNRQFFAQPFGAPGQPPPLGTEIFANEQGVVVAPQGQGLRIQFTTSVPAGGVAILDEKWDFSCANPSGHSFTLAKNVQPANPHISDPAPVNNNLNANFDVAVIAQADLEVVSLEVVNPPLEVQIDQDFQLAGREVVRNNGPFGPVAFNLAGGGQVPSDCTVIPGPGAPLPKLGSRQEVTIEGSVTLRCSSPSFHTFNATSTVVPVDQHVRDSVPENNTKNLSVTVAVIAYADLELVDLQAAVPSNLDVGQTASFGSTAMVRNNGPFGPVDAFNGRSVDVQPGMEGSVTVGDASDLVFVTEGVTYRVIRDGQVVQGPSVAGAPQPGQPGQLILNLQAGDVVKVVGTDIQAPLPIGGFAPEVRIGVSLPGLAAGETQSITRTLDVACLQLGTYTVIVGSRTQTGDIHIRDTVPNNGQQVQAQVECSTNPARTIGYWKIHESQITAMLTRGSIDLGDRTVADVSQALDVLSNANAKDARDALRAQLLGTILNLRNGSNLFATGPDIRPTVSAATGFLFSHPMAVTADHPDRATAIDLKDALDAYNNSGE